MTTFTIQGMPLNLVHFHPVQGGGAGRRATEWRVRGNEFTAAPSEAGARALEALASNIQGLADVQSPIPVVSEYETLIGWWRDIQASTAVKRHLNTLVLDWRIRGIRVHGQHELQFVGLDRNNTLGASDAALERDLWLCFGRSRNSVPGRYADGR